MMELSSSLLCVETHRDGRFSLLVGPELTPVRSIFAREDLGNIHQHAGTVVDAES